MAIKLTKKDSKTQEATAVHAPAQLGEHGPGAYTYLPEDVQAEVQSLSAEVQAKFAKFTELTPAVLDEVMADIPETLTERLLEVMESQMDEQLPNVATAPAQEVTAQESPVTDDKDRKAQRDALKAEILANSQTVKPAATVQAPANLDGKPVKTVAATQPASVNFVPWDNLFPVGQQVIVINRGSGKFEVHFGSVAPEAKPVEVKAEAPAKKEKKVKVSSISNNPDYWTQEYKDFLADMKASYADLNSRIKLAESLGLVRGTDWADKTKAGEPQHAAIENMQLMNAIREKKGISIYVPEADTTEKRKALVHANS